MKNQILGRIEKLEARAPFSAAHWLASSDGDFTKLSNEELAAVTREIDQQTIRALGSQQGRAELDRIKAMSNEELERMITL